MQSRISRSWLAVASLAFASAAAFAQNGDAQQSSAPAASSAQAEREADRVSERAGRGQQDIEQEAARARAEMERAAAEYAKLAAQYAGPVVNEVTRRFGYTGQRAMLGLNVADGEQGARVNGVSPNGPAAEAGLKEGDVIVSVDGVKLVGGDSHESPSERLISQMRTVEPGKDVKLGILRDGKPQDVTVRARELPADRTFCFQGRGQGEPCTSWSFPGPQTWQRFFGGYNPWRDMQLVALTPGLGAYFGTETGLLVVRGPSDAALALRDGDVILDIGGRAPTSPEHALRILASFDPGEKLKIAIMRNKKRQTLDVTMPADPAPGRR